MFHESRDLGSCLSGSDAVYLLELIHESLSCREEEDFKLLFRRLERLLPFDFAHALLGYQDENRKIVIDHGVNISFPREWVSEFLARDYLQVAVVVRNNFMNYGLQHWPDTKKRLDEKKEVLALFHDYDMSDGYTIGARPLSAERHGSMFCFSGPSLEYGRRSETILELIGPHMHLALTNSYRLKRRGNRKINLSGREKEVLNWLQQGKSSWEMSMILGISQSTVNFHVYNVMQKLGAVNRPQAVAVATHMGIIAPA